jgi:hypothetical protein
MDESQYLFEDADHRRMVAEILSAIRLHNAVISGFLENQNQAVGPEMMKALIYHCRKIGQAVEGMKT